MRTFINIMTAPAAAINMPVAAIGRVCDKVDMG